MNWEALTQFAKVLVWPVTLIIIVIILRDAIRRLIPGLNRLRYKDFEIEFNKQVSHVRANLEQRAHTDAPNPATEMLNDYYETIAEVSPRAAILEAWIGFETTALSSARVLDLLPQDSVIPTRKLMNALQEGELLNSEEVRSIAKLRTLRNEVVHERDVRISKESAVEYAWVLRELAEEIATRAHTRLPKNC